VLYTEKRLNKVFVVDDMKASVVMEGYDEELVKGGEVEKKVRLVLQSEEGESSGRRWQWRRRRLPVVSAG
jgi:hypothetical protein